MDSSSQGGQSGPTSAGLRSGFLARPCSACPAPAGAPVRDQCHQVHRFSVVAHSLLCLGEHGWMLGKQVQGKVTGLLQVCSTRL